MSFKQVFTDVLTKLESIPADKVISNPKPASNFQKTPSNVNQKFKFNSIWNEQIDNEIKGSENIIIKCPACFIEFDTGDGMLIGGGVTQYLDARMYFHIYSDQLNATNKVGGDYMDVNLEIFDLRDCIKSNFTGFHTHNASFGMPCVDKLDYKHKTITKYVIGFCFPFYDEKGSIFDPKSALYKTFKTSSGIGLGVTPTHYWVSGASYQELVNVIFIVGSVMPLVIEGYYLCLHSNNDMVFTTLNWQILALWTPGNWVVGQYIYLGIYCYVCLNANNDLTFTPSNWTLICRM